MRKRVFGRKFKRDKNERKALFKNLASSLLVYERIETTEEKAKSIRGYVEKLITKAKNKGITAKKYVEPYLTPVGVKRLYEVAPRFADRPGGYVRLIKMEKRFSDNASMVVMELVEKSQKVELPVAETGKKNKTESKEVALSVTEKTTKTKSVKKVTKKKAVKKEAK